MGCTFNRSSKRDRPSWYAKWKDENGVWITRPTHQPTKALADRYVAAVEARIAAGKVGVPQPPPPEELARKKLTVRQLGERFTSEYSSPRIKDPPKYRQMAKWLFKKHLYDTLGSVPVVDLTSAQLEHFRDQQLEKGRAAQSVRHVLAFVSRMFNWGASKDIISCPNPAAKVDKPTLGDADDFAYLSQEEAANLLAWAAQNQPDEHPHYATALYTGMRYGELAGLRWTDVDFARAMISVRRSYRSTPKSGKARHLPISPFLLPILRSWKERCPASEEGLVFPSPAGCMRNNHNDKHRGCFEAALTGAKCHSVRFHDLRHSYASAFMMSGGNILTLQRLLGHSSVVVTEKYSHLSPHFLAGEGARVSFEQPKQAGVVALADRRQPAQPA